MKEQCLNNFFKSKKGAITIEFFFMVLLLGILFAFMADLVILRSTLGKLDSASFSLVNILRERTQLYDNAVRLEGKDLTQFQQLAKLVLYGDKNSNQKVDVVLEVWYVDNAGKEQVQTLGETAACSPYKPVKELKDLSPYSEIEFRERKVPLYQVTLCVNSRASLFKALLLNEATKTSLGTIRSSTVAVSR